MSESVSTSSLLPELDSFPILPPDLERPILELCASLWPTSIRKLMFKLVASRFKDWGEPLLYRTIILDDDAHGHPSFTYLTLLRAVTSKPPSFFRDCVKIICIHPWLNEATVEMLLRVCTRVENLSVNTATLYFLLSSPEPDLKYLYTAFRPFLELPPTHRIFSCLTHIEMLPVFSGEINRISSLLPPPSFPPSPSYPPGILAHGTSPRLSTSIEYMQISRCSDFVQMASRAASFPPPIWCSIYTRSSVRVHAKFIRLD